MKSKLISVLTLAVLVTFAGFAQKKKSPCSLLPYKIFKETANKKPVTLNILGTSPQFGEIPDHTGESAYNHLQMVYKKNVKNSRVEIDGFLRALGFTGLNDPSFSSSNLIPEILTAGTVGWMGAYSRGHKYAWSSLGNDFQTFRVYAKGSSCFLYIMKKCGNAFYVPDAIGNSIDTYKFGPQPTIAVCPPGTSPCPCGEGYVCNANGCCVPAPPKIFCKKQTITISGSGQVQSGDVMNSTKTMEIVAVNSNGGATKGLLLGSYPVQVRSTYDFNLKGETQFTKTVEVCVEGNADPAPMNLILPMNLNYTITKNDVNVGDGEKIYLNVDAAQYKALSKAYKAVNVATTSSPNMEAAAKKVVGSTTAETTATAFGSGDPKCADQKINFMGKTQIEDGSVKSTTNDVTIIGVYKKTGKLAKGEMADKYLCLGSFQVPVKSAYNFTTTGGSDVSKLLRVCTKDGMAPGDQNINVPVKMTYNFTKQDVTLGDYNKVYVSLTESQYKSLSKSYNRCCTGGGEGKACK